MAAHSRSGGRFWNPAASLGSPGAEEDEENVERQRPEILQKMFRAREGKTGQKPREFDVFQMQVQENNIQLARFDFLQLNAWYEGLQVGPSNPVVPAQGSTALEMMFKYYAARRQNSHEGGTLATFEEIQEANATVDMSELTKFMKEFMPGVFNRKEINWMFKMSNQMANGLSDDCVHTMDYDEFVGMLCIVAMQLYRGCKPKEMGRELGKRLELHDPLAMRAKLKRMGKMDAGFGAWKCDTYGPVVEKYDPTRRFPLEPDAGKYCLDYHDFCDVKKTLMEGFPDVKIPEWLPFPGPFIAFVYPTKGAREGKKIRFKVAVRNVAPRAIDLYARLVDLPNVSLTETGEHGSVAPGMDKTCTIIVENILPISQVGGLIFSAEESGPELFRCPIFLRATTGGHSMVGEHICSQIAEAVDIPQMRDKFRSQDNDHSGRVSVDLFQKTVKDLGIELEDELKSELTNNVVEIEKAEGDDSFLVDYDEFVNKISHMAQKSPTKQKAKPQDISALKGSAKAKSPAKGVLKSKERVKEEGGGGGEGGRGGKEEKGEKERQRERKCEGEL